MTTLITDVTASAAQLERSAQVIPGGVNSARRQSQVPTCVRRAEGPWIETVDGNRLLDYHAAYSAMSLGHAFPAVVDAVREAAGRGTLHGIGVHEGEIEVAALLAEHVPSVEKAILVNSGSEATYHAIRLARGITGREKILKFQRNYHGFHDYVLARTMEAKGAEAGVLRSAADAIVVARYNDLQAAEQAVAENSGEIAAIILEPILHNSPAATIVPGDGYLEGLRAIADREGIILIFDEVVSGFRHSIGGFQKTSGVTPDLTTMGKAMANAFPIAAVGGKAEYMNHYSSYPGGDVFLAGTYSGNAIGTAAATATISVCANEPVYEHTFALGERMRAGLREIVDRAGVSAVVTGFGALFVLGFMEGPIETSDDLEHNDTELFLAYRRELVKRGILELPELGGSGRNCISYSHTEDQIDMTLEAAEQALAAALDEKANGYPGAPSPS